MRQSGGRVDALFANAGVALPAPMEAVDEDHFDTIFDTNVKSLYFTTQVGATLRNHHNLWAEGLVRTD